MSELSPLVIPLLKDSKLHLREELSSDVVMQASTTNIDIDQLSRHLRNITERKMTHHLKEGESPCLECKYRETDIEIIPNFEGYSIKAQATMYCKNHVHCPEIPKPTKAPFKNPFIAEEAVEAEDPKAPSTYGEW